MAEFQFQTLKKHLGARTCFVAVAYWYWKSSIWISCQELYLWWVEQKQFLIYLSATKRVSKFSGQPTSQHFLQMMYHIKLLLLFFHCFVSMQIHLLWYSIGCFLWRNKLNTLFLVSLLVYCISTSFILFVIIDSRRYIDRGDWLIWS